MNKIEEELLQIANNTDDVALNKKDLSEADYLKECRKHIDLLVSGYTPDYPNSAFIAYCIGYTWFWLVGFYSDAFNESKKWLEESINLDPEDDYVRYYLGVLYYEEERYKYCIDTLGEIKKNSFKKFDQEWRDINTFAYLECSKALLGNMEVSNLKTICRVFKDDISCELDDPIMLIDTCNALWKKEDNSGKDDLYIFTYSLIDMLKNNPCYLDVYSEKIKELSKRIIIGKK